MHSLLPTGSAPALEAADLLVSEVVANAVLHAHTWAHLVLRLRGRLLRVEVTDTGTGQLARRDTPDEEGGFGMRILDALADRWGVEARPRGKVVWFELLVPA